MRYFCVIFAFLAILLCGCSSDENFVYGTGETLLDVKITVVDKANKPYAQAPVTLLSLSGDIISGTADNDGAISKTLPTGEWGVALYASPKMVSKVVIVAGQQDYTVEIDRPDVSDASFNFTVEPPIEKPEPDPTEPPRNNVECYLLPYGEDWYNYEKNSDPSAFYNIIALRQDSEDTLYYPVSVFDSEKLTSIPTGSYYVCYIYKSLQLQEVIVYFSGIINIVPETAFPMNVTVNRTVSALINILDDKGNQFNKDVQTVRFENVETGLVFYSCDLGNSSSFGKYFLPQAGTYNVSMPLFSPDIRTITTGEEVLSLQFTRFNIDGTDMSFILKDLNGNLIPTTMTGLQLKNNYGLVIAELKYDSENSCWKPDAISSTLPVGVYKIQVDDEFGVYSSNSFVVIIGLKYPLDLEGYCTIH